jgi:exosortase family protein XrtF
MATLSILKIYKPTLVFLAKFSGTYLVLALIYQWYLSAYTGQTDPFTLRTGELVSRLFYITGLQATALPLPDESGLQLLINGEYVARIVEGCNAISVIIMFAAFTLSFGNFIKKSLIFTIAGSFLIYIFNLFRIVFLGYLLYMLPKWQDLAHRVIFPGLIYGFVIVLWIIFVKKINSETLQ